MWPGALQRGQRRRCARHLNALWVRAIARPAALPVPATAARSRARARGSAPAPHAPRPPTEDFKKQYNEYRELRKPSPPEKPKTAEELKNEYKADLQKSLEETNKAKSNVSADQQAMFDASIKYIEEQLKAIDDPNNPMFSPEMDTYSQMGYEQQMEQHKKDVAEWETKYPINNPKPLIKIWLESFLEQTKDVDFNAQTAIDKGRTLFVNRNTSEKIICGNYAIGQVKKQQKPVGNLLKPGWVN